MGLPGPEPEQKGKAGQGDAACWRFGRGGFWDGSAAVRVRSRGTPCRPCPTETDGLPHDDPANATARQPRELYGERIIAAGETVEGIGRTVTGIVLARSAPARWWLALAVACGLIGLFAASLGHLGTGNAGAPVVSPLAVASYDWWVGIAHGSLLVAAVLLLAGVEWRCAVIRITETVALLGAIVAAFYALLPLGRPGWLDPALPWRGTAGPLPPFGSPGAWDATGLACCVVVCAGLWYVGLLPDLATLRDDVLEAARARTDGPGHPRRQLRARLYGLLAVGWRGSAVQWQRWVEAYRAVALIGALLVIVLQAGASVELAASAPPGRHDTLLPVTFLVGAVLSGVGVMAALVGAVRAVYGLGGLITRRHLDILARLILVLGLASLYCHVTEMLATLLYGDAFARGIVARGLDGDLAWIFWTIVACGLLPVQVFWLPRARRSGLVIAVVGTLAAIGAYADHVMVLVVALQNDAMPLLPRTNVPGGGDVVTFAGSIGLFLALLLLVLRTLPIVSIAQARQLAIVHNASEATTITPETAGPDRTAAPIRRIAAAFATEKALAAAVNALLGRDRGFRLDACGPVPLPSVFAALRPVEHPIRRTALVSALAGGFGFLALCIAGALWLSPLGTGARLQASWPFFVLPSVAVALTTGTLAILVTLLVRSRLPQRSVAVDGPGFPRSGRNRFRLTAEIRDGTDDAERIAQRLAGLPADAGRPSALRGMPR